MGNKNKPKILHIVYSFGMGGMENGVANIINNTHDLFTHIICCMSQTGATSNKLIPSIPIIEMHKAEKSNTAITILKLSRLISHQKPAIVHTRNWGGIDGIPAATMARIPVKIHSEHGWTADDPFGDNYKRLLYRRFIGNFLATHCISVSPEIKKWMVDRVRIPSQKITTIINGVDTEKFKPTRSKVFSTILGLSPDNLIIANVCRLDPIKNNQLLLKAFSTLNKRYPNTSLIIIGDGPEKSYLKNFINHLHCRNKIFLLGERKDIQQLLPAVDIFVSTSLNEGISNTILEAMACGVPIVASSVGGNTILVQEEITGFLFTSGNLPELVRKLELYLIYPEIRKQHAKNARKAVLNNFSLEHMVKEYSNLYQNLLSTKKF